MNLTSEQQLIVNHITANDGLALVSSVAGSGKTTLLKALSASLPHTNGLYLAYNKSIATQSKKAFPETTSCLTTHSLAYKATIKAFKLTVGFFGYREITDKLPYEFKCTVAELLREFCLSKHLDYADFATNYVEDIDKFTPFVLKYLQQMQQGTIDVTHDFYLKLFHILLASGELTYPEFDFVLLDEAGDINPVTAEIFMLLPTKKRIAVGDPFQNIYSFNHTINCFETLDEFGTTFTLSQSFRVPEVIASKVESFCRNYMNPDMVFKGIDNPPTKVATRGYITRTNAALISQMITLNKAQTPYGLVRKASEIFKLPLMLCNIKRNGFISDIRYKHIQKDFDDWYDDASMKLKYASPLMYIAMLYDDDIQLANSIKVVLSFGKYDVIQAFYEAKKHESTNQNYTLTTAHSCKGLEFDEVTIGDDLNNSIKEIVAYMNTTPDAILLPEQREAFNLYYVAVTRALVRLNNANHLT